MRVLNMTHVAGTFNYKIDSKRNYDWKVLLVKKMGGKWATIGKTQTLESMDAFEVEGKIRDGLVRWPQKCPILMSSHTNLDVEVHTEYEIFFVKVLFEVQIEFTKAEWAALLLMHPRTNYNHVEKNNKRIIKKWIETDRNIGFIPEFGKGKTIKI